MKLDLLKRRYSLKKILILSGIFLLILLFGIIYFSNSWDFKTFYDIGMLARQKNNIYLASQTTGLFVFYSPFFSILMMLFTFFPERVSACLFFYLNFILMIILFKDLLNDYKEIVDTKRKRMLAIILIYVMVVNFFWLDFHLGQVNFIVCFLTILGIRLYYEKKYGLSAFCLVLSTFKVVPLIFFFFVLFSKKVKYILFYLGFLIFFILLPLFHFGIEEGFLLYKNFYTLAILQKAGINSIGLNQFNNNQSLWKLFGNLLKALQISSNEILIFAIVSLLLIALFYTFLLTKELYNKKIEIIYLIGSGFILLMLLFSPDTASSSHLTNLLLPYSILVFNVLKTKGKTEIALISLVLIGNIFATEEIIGKKIDRIFHQNYGFTIIMLMVLFYVFYRLNEIRKTKLFDVSN
ncbi:MAG: glycosyltransferase 87 family protein [Elusimicrobia bacterium]|nr:glycosyltransferase 87 family protein [Elusimicrobiota bacterium]